ncbi:MAG TPA: hypothetical protein VHB77_05220 [Planctomycetaceae bacterium]|nr:hypothetical protein [Planctomycetaceae bacterium]
MNSTKARVAMGLTMAIVGLTGALAVKKGLAEIQRIESPPVIAATAASTPEAPAEPAPAGPKLHLAEPQFAKPNGSPTPTPADTPTPKAVITTVEEERLIPIPETDEFHSQIFRGSVREDVSFPENDSAQNARDPE